jgi:hypothetical protein
MWLASPRPFCPANNHFLPCVPRSAIASGTLHQRQLYSLLSVAAQPLNDRPDELGPAALHLRSLDFIWKLPRLRITSISLASTSLDQEGPYFHCPSHFGNAAPSLFCRTPNLVGFSTSTHPLLLLADEFFASCSTIRTGLFALQLDELPSKNFA